MNNPKYRTLFDDDARAELRKIGKKTALRILAKLTELESNPRGLGTTEIVGRPGIRRLRVGDWRVLYQIKDAVLVILVVEVGHRSSIYGG